MACKIDVKQAILNKVFEELTESRYSFSRISADTIQINSKADNTKSRVNHAEQARAIAKELLSRANSSFYGHVNGYVNQVSAFDPVTVTFTVSDRYIDHVYNNLPSSQKTDISNAVNTEERNHINTNTGPNSYQQIELFSPEEASAGTFVKFIQFKKNQLYEFQKRLNRVEAAQKKSGLTTEQLTKLKNTERELKLQIEGNFELGIKGLRQEIMELEKGAETKAIGFYVEKDLQRLDKLAKSNNLDDLNEAQRIIDFYNLAGTFRRNIDNPFFTQEEMFLEDEDGNLTTVYKLDDEVMQQYKTWADKAGAYQNTIEKRKEEVTVDAVNNDPSVKKTYGKRKFSFDELIQDQTGLGDTDWVSMWTMDITQGMFSTNGVLPQVMFSYLANSFEKKLAWAKRMEEKIDQMNPGVQRELIKLGYSLRAGGILGLTGASYQLFKEITKEGNETGGLVQRFVKEFFDEQSKQLNKFRERFDNARLVGDYAQRAATYNKAFEELKRWRRNNTIIMDIDKLPEFNNAVTDMSHKNQLVSILGDKGYKEEVEKQQALLRKYESEKQSMIETLLIMENKPDYNSLSDKAKSDLNYWENNHDPKRGIEDYHSVKGIFFGDRKANNFMDYNNFIPRKFNTTISVDNSTNQYQFTDTTTPTGHYSEAFQKIESNPVLGEFYDVLKEITQTIRENLPYELQQKMSVNTLPALQKTSTEIIADKNIGILSSLFLAFKHLVEKIRMGFGITKQSEISHAVVDPITGIANYKVNDQFLQGNTRAISGMMKLEKTKFLQAINANKPNDAKVKGIRRFSVFNLDTLNTESLVLLSNYLHLDIPLADLQARRLDKIRAITGDNVEVGKYIRDYSLHSVVQSQSFDLAKIGKYFSKMTMLYAARQEALPILEIMKNHYEAIRKPKTNNLGKGIYDANNGTYIKTGLRTNAIKQMDDWFERVALGNYDTKHIGPHGVSGRSNPKIAKLEDKIKQIDTDLVDPNLSQDKRDALTAQREKLILKKNIPGYGKTIYSSEDKRKLVEIENLLKHETDEKKRTELIIMKANLGKARTATAILDNILAYIRTLRLGYNLSSATTNFLEGVTSNMILSSMGEYFDPKEIFYGYAVTRHSFIKNLTFGHAETGLAKRNRALMDKFGVIMDSKNELQKSSVRTYASKLSWLNPHALNTRVEYVNQSPIMIAMLRTEKIKDKNGKESSVWDAFKNDGHLKDDFRTEENVKNWEELSGEQYLNFKQKLHKAIVLGHGNYDELRGMMVKSNSAGKALMMFKTWLPMQFYWRFATEQDDIQSGTIGYKGRYWSYGKGSGLVHGAAVGTAIFGPLGAVAGGALGTFLGAFFGTDSGVSMLREVIESSKALIKKSIGMPVNMIAGRQIIGMGNNAFKDWVGKGDFTEQDAKNLRGNMSDISMQLAWIALILLAKSIFWDDDDEADSPERKTHNLLVNKLMQLSSQASMYVNPVETLKSTFGNNAVVQYFQEVGKELFRVSEYLHGRDIIATGQNAGESGLLNQSKKTFMPGIFKGVSTLGFESQMEGVIVESPFHPYFRSKATLDKQDNQRDRAARRLELEDAIDEDNLEGETKSDRIKAKEKMIKKMVDEEFPTGTKLKKLGVTREEYDAWREEQQQNQEQE